MAPVPQLQQYSVTEMSPKGDDEHTSPSMSSKKSNETPTSADVASASLSNVTTRQRDEYLLPPLLDEHQDRKTLVLDLDETLVHASVVPLPHYDFLLEFPADAINDAGVMYMLKRPGVDEFLDWAAKLFEVVIFTAASRTYADAVLDRLDLNGALITHRLYYPQCTKLLLLSDEDEKVIVNVKDLTRLGRDMSKTIIVDNSPVAYFLQPENAVPISSYFEHRPDDGELSRVMSILRTFVKRNEDVREVLQQFL